MVNDSPVNSNWEVGAAGSQLRLGGCCSSLTRFGFEAVVGLLVVWRPGVRSSVVLGYLFALLRYVNGVGDPPTMHTILGHCD